MEDKYQKGNSLIEYALLMLCVVILGIFSLSGLGNTLRDKYQAIANAENDPTSIVLPQPTAQATAVVPAATPTAPAPPEPPSTIYSVAVKRDGKSRNLSLNIVVDKPTKILVKDSATGAAWTIVCKGKCHTTLKNVGDSGGFLIIQPKGDDPVTVAYPAR